MDTPAQGHFRTVVADTELHGVTLAAGDTVFLGRSAANRDPREFPEPDEFVCDREPNRHVAFGSGHHRCLGAHLARLEVRVALEELLRAVPTTRSRPRPSRCRPPAGIVPWK